MESKLTVDTLINMFYSIKDAKLSGVEHAAAYRFIKTIVRSRGIDPESIDLHSLFYSSTLARDVLGKTYTGYTSITVETACKIIWDAIKKVS